MLKWIVGAEVATARGRCWPGFWRGFVALNVILRMGRVFERTALMFVFFDILGGAFGGWEEEVRKECGW